MKELNKINRINKSIVLPPKEILNAVNSSDVLNKIGCSPSYKALTTNGKLILLETLIHSENTTVDQKLKALEMHNKLMGSYEESKNNARYSGPKKYTWGTPIETEASK